MRTTIDINDDLLAALRKKAMESGIPLKAVVNQALRLGLTAKKKPKQVDEFRCRTFSMGFPPRQAIDKVRDHF